MSLSPSPTTTYLILIIYFITFNKRKHFLLKPIIEDLNEIMPKNLKKNVSLRSIGT